MYDCEEMKYKTLPSLPASLSPSFFCYDSKTSTPSVLIDVHQRERLKKMHLFTIYNFVLSIDCFFSFDSAAPTLKVKDYSLVYNCTTIGALKYDFVCLCMQSSTNGQCHNLYTVAQACSVEPSTPSPPPQPSTANPKAVGRSTTTTTTTKTTTTTTRTTPKSASTTTTTTASPVTLPSSPPPPPPPPSEQPKANQVRRALSLF